MIIANASGARGAQADGASLSSEALWPTEGVWHLLHTKSRQEKLLADELHRMGIGHYLPLKRQTRQYLKRKGTVQLPLLPGYVFLRGSIEDAYQANRTHRVARIIPVADQARLEWELKNLRLALASTPCLDPYPYLRKGVRVRVCSGPFQGIEGLVEDRSSVDRLVLQVEMLGRAVSIEVSGAVLEPL